LPILVGLIGFAARAAVPMNQILSLVTLVTALVVRWHTGSLVGVGVFASAVIALDFGGVTAAWFAAHLLKLQGAGGQLNSLCAPGHITAAVEFFALADALMRRYYPRPFPRQ
jgi:hypothetical protein